MIKGYTVEPTDVTNALNALASCARIGLPAVIRTICGAKRGTFEILHGLVMCAVTRQMPELGFRSCCRSGPRW
jgi:hypothetical protein